MSAIIIKSCIWKLASKKQHWLLYNLTKLCQQVLFHINWRSDSKNEIKKKKKKKKKKKLIFFYKVMVIYWKRLYRVHDDKHNITWKYYKRVIHKYKENE